MRRRKFIALLGSFAVAWPLTARGQRLDRMRRIGMLMSASENDTEYRSLLATFGDELRKLGWEQGGNLGIDYRWKRSMKNRDNDWQRNSLRYSLT
jgi:hypothetical protein